MESTLKSFTATEAESRFSQLLNTAKRQPVTVTEDGEPSVVVMSALVYEARRQRAKQRLKETVKRSQAYAVSQGLTEEILDELLADES